MKYSTFVVAAAAGSAAAASAPAYGQCVCTRFLIRLVIVSCILTFSLRVETDGLVPLIVRLATTAPARTTGTLSASLALALMPLPP
jgi:endoglucanase